MAPHSTAPSDGSTSAVVASSLVAKRQDVVPRFENGLIDVSCKREEDAKITQQNAQQSPLLRLPAELRNRIWELVLGGKVQFLNRKNFDWWEDDTNDVYQVTDQGTPLLRTCRQAYVETALLPFNLNKFCFPIYGCGWLEELPQYAQVNIRRICVDSYQVHWRRGWSNTIWELTMVIKEMLFGLEHVVLIVRSDLWDLFESESDLVKSQARFKSFIDKLDRGIKVEFENR